MDRDFPIGRPRRPATVRGVRAVVGAAAALSLFVGLLSPAFADREDDLEERRDRVGERVHAAHGELAHSSRRLQRATAVLRAFQHRLAKARADLAVTLGRLAVARQLDEQMQQALDDAERRLAAARAQLAAAERVVDEALDSIERFAVQSYATGDPGLISVDAVLNGDSPMAFPQMLSSAESMVNAQTATLDELDAARVMMALRARRVEQLRDKVAAQRRAAAENLERKQALAHEARAERRAVQVLVDERQAARHRAQQARQHDLRIVRAMEREQERVQAMLEQLQARQQARQLARQLAAERARQQAAQSASPDSVVPQNDGGFLDYPVPGAYVTSSYGMRFHPVLRYVKLHDGTDFGAGCGTPILAPADGVVVGQYYNGGYGNRVLLAHGTVDGQQLATSINHLSGFATSDGESVARGEVIGYVGSTGYSTGCHLHFMVYVNGATVDPMTWL